MACLWRSGGARRGTKSEGDLSRSEKWIQLVELAAGWRNRTFGISVRSIPLMPFHMLNSNEFCVVLQQFLYIYIDYSPFSVLYIGGKFPNQSMFGSLCHKLPAWNLQNGSNNFNLLQGTAIGISIGEVCLSCCSICSCNSNEFCVRVCVCVCVCVLAIYTMSLFLYTYDTILNPASRRLPSSSCAIAACLAFVFPRPPKFENNCCLMEDDAIDARFATFFF